MTNSTEEIDSIILYLDNNCVKSTDDYKLEKTGIAAYKLIIKNCKSLKDIYVNSNEYIVIINNIVKDEGVVGLLVVFNNDIKFCKDQVIFEIGSNKTSVFDKYYVESRKK
ncbi:TLP20 [Choristoneura occidentalis granulovirus]|uniref:TLP20 n=1 Tax=Choristoneura occidentalis granulovirus TaxID=364745 RepID=Q1A4L5_9BBAC|nr:TLP20 [Choristoneura fumiferana granulovirus]ABC61215.1 TLP20 [Choristoneura fumiferana granulovirus]